MAGGGESSKVKGVMTGGKVSHKDKKVSYIPSKLAQSIHDRFIIKIDNFPE